MIMDQNDLGGRLPCIYNIRSKPNQGHQISIILHLILKIGGAARRLYPRNQYNARYFMYDVIALMRRRTQFALRGHQIALTRHDIIIPMLPLLKNSNRSNYGTLPCSLTQKRRIFHIRTIEHVLFSWFSTVVCICNFTQSLTISLILKALHEKRALVEVCIVRGFFMRHFRECRS